MSHHPSNQKYTIRVDNLDDCPLTDNPVIISSDCKGCDYYVKFQIESGLRCVYCSYRYKN